MHKKRAEPEPARLVSFGWIDNLLPALSPNMDQIAIILLADILHQFSTAQREWTRPIRVPGDSRHHRKRLGVKLGICDGCFNLHVVKAGPSVLLCDLHLLSMRMTRSVQP